MHWGCDLRGLAPSGDWAVFLRGTFGHAFGQGLRRKVVWPRSADPSSQTCHEGVERAACAHLTGAPSGALCTATPHACQSLWVERRESPAAQRLA